MGRAIGNSLKLPAAGFGRPGDQPLRVSRRRARVATRGTRINLTTGWTRHTISKPSSARGGPPYHREARSCEHRSHRPRHLLSRICGTCTTRAPPPSPVQACRSHRAAWIGDDFRPRLSSFLGLNPKRELCLVTITQYHCNEAGSNKADLMQTILSHFAATKTPTRNRRYPAMLQDIEHGNANN